MTTEYLAKPALSSARQAALHAYVVKLRRFLYLTHWRIDLPNEWPEDQESIAEIKPCDGRFVATIRFGASFWYRSSEEARDTLVHELLHLHHVRLTDMVRLGEYRQQLGQTLYEHVEAQAKLEAEYMVDGLTTIVAEHAPRPPKKWPA